MLRFNSGVKENEPCPEPSSAGIWPAKPIPSPRRNSSFFHAAPVSCAGAKPAMASAHNAIRLFILEASAESGKHGRLPQLGQLAPGDVRPLAGRIEVEGRGPMMDRLHGLLRSLI